MTTPELIKIIANSESAQWFNSAESNISYPHINFSQNFDGIPSLHRFITDQIEGWNKFGNLPNELSETLKHFNNLKAEIENFVSSYKNKSNEYLNGNWKNQQIQIAKNNTSNPFFTFDSPEVKFLIDMFQKFPNSFQGAYLFVIGQFRTNNKNDLIGALLAYEFELKDHTEIAQRKNKEKASISRIRNDFQKLLSKSQTELTNHLTNANEEYESYVKSIDNLKSDKEESFNEWYDKTKKTFSIFNDGSNTRISELEQTYAEKLKLEKPARYWESKSKKYYKDATKIRTILLWLVGISAVFLSVILMLSPDWIFKNVFKGNATAIIRWSIVFITLISLVAYAIRALTKVMFSSYHLARDAEERHTLTFFYLALLKDSTVGDEDRKLILQSLFSRVDTGLLKDESGPTMPNDVIGKILGKYKTGG